MQKIPHLLLVSVSLWFATQVVAGHRVVWISRGEPPQAIARFTVEIADEPDEWRWGLMERASLAPNAGMLFIFPDVAPRAFWMLNTVIRLDMLFADADGRILNIQNNVPPCLPPHRCPTYHSAAPAKYVLEIAGGRARALGLRVGDRLRF